MPQYQSGNLYAEERIKSYIHSSLIPRMTILDATKDFEESSKLRNEMHAVFKGGHAHLLHEAMIQFYEKYIHFDTELFGHSRISLRLEIWNLMEADPYFGQWFENNDLLELVESWCCGMTESQYNTIFHLMKCALNNGYDNDWEKLSDEFRIRLLSEVECGTPWSREVYAVMNGICMICKSSLGESEKMQLLDKMKNNWDFLRYLYSVMFRQFIGCNYRNFTQVANMIHFRSAYHPYAHLFYAVFVERADEFVKRKADQKKFDEHLKKIEEVMESTPKSDALDALCDLLFPEELSEYLAKHRPKDARQLREEIAQLREELGETTRQMNQQVQAMADKMKALLEASVPIEEIEQELLMLDYNEAMEVFKQLNTLLLNNQAWMNNAKSIRNRIYQLKNASKGGDTYNYASGATHNDERRTLNIKQENESNLLE
ncbi:MAG: hypothetical protein IKU64_05365 [Bacteroides sp.]|nr:hypothetical protein [Bacteroides sp.]